MHVSSPVHMVELNIGKGRLAINQASNTMLSTIILCIIVCLGNVLSRTIFIGTYILHHILILEILTEVSNV